MRAVDALTRWPDAVQRDLLAALGLPHYPGAADAVVAAAGVGSADIVITLLRLGTPETLTCVEEVLGRPVTRCPPGLRTQPARDTLDAEVEWLTRLVGESTGSEADGRRFTRVTPNPRLPTTPAAGRYALLRPGMTVGQFLARGGRRRDVREWVAAGDVQLEDNTGVDNDW